MPTDGYLSSNSLDASLHAQVDQISQAFEKAWLHRLSSGNRAPPNLQEFFGRLEAEGPVREYLFRELLILDVHYRRKRGEQPGVESYRERFPEQLHLVHTLFSDTLTNESGNVPSQSEPSSQSPSEDTDSRMGEVAPSTSRTRRELKVTGEGDSAPGSLHAKHLGRYEIVKQLGKGKFGKVYLARDPQLDRLVAIKAARSGLFSSQESAARFLDEARKAAQLDEHQGIVTIHDVGCENDVYYIVMDYVEGGTLADPKVGEGLSPLDAADLIAKVADAVHFAHTKGLLHRDIKPANILLDRDGVPQVADFGLAVHESEQLRKRGEICGTLHYMSPEQVQGYTDHLDGRTDIWSLGVTLYELLSHRRPFLGDSREELIEQILHRDVRPLRQIEESTPRVLEQICMTALQKEPSARYHTASDLARELRKAVRTERVKAKPRTRRRTWVAAIAVVAALLLLSTGEVYRWLVPWIQAMVPPPQFELVRSFAEKQMNITSIDIVSANAHCASGDQDGLFYLWNWETGVPVGRYQAPAEICEVCLSAAGDRAVLLCADSSCVALAVPEMTVESHPADFDRKLPDQLIRGLADTPISAILASKNGLLLRSIQEDQPPATLPVSSDWSHLVAARSGQYFVAAGYGAADEEWRLKRWDLKAGPAPIPEDVPLLARGPICSVAVAVGGQVAVGGYGPDVGVQVWRGGAASPIKLDVGGDCAGYCYYHTVSISPDGEYVYAVSHCIPPTGKKFAILRAWAVGELLRDFEKQQVVDVERIHAPVQAAVFLPEERRLLLSVSQTLQLWQF